MRSKLKYVPLIIWLCVIFLFSSRPAVQTQTSARQDFFIKKTAHVVEYSICAFLAWHAFISTNRIKVKNVIFIWIFIALFALTDEYHQSFTPTRQPKIRDVVIDSVAAGGVLLYLFSHSKNYRIVRAKTIG